MTGKQIVQMSNLSFAAWVCQEKLDRLGNPNTLMAQKLRHTINTLRELDMEEQRDE